MCGGEGEGLVIGFGVVVVLYVWVVVFGVYVLCIVGGVVLEEVCCWIE